MDNRITQSQSRVKTGLSYRIISKTYTMLSDRELITISEEL